MKVSKQKVYEAPKAETIAIATQSVLCASGATPTPTPAPTTPGGNGFQFGTDSGNW